MCSSWPGGEGYENESMKVLFVSSGNKRSGISQVVENQGASLERQQLEVDYYKIVGKGIWGYLRNIPRLHRAIRNENYDIIHAHYSLSGFLATLATPRNKNIVVSLMGTFRKGTLKYVLVRFLSRYRWKAVIVKSERMRAQIGLDKAFLVPNGVELQKFNGFPPRDILRRELGFAEDRKTVIFVADPSRPEKNFRLCRDAVERLGDHSVELLVVYNKPHEEVVRYMAAADVLMLTSFTEGSPNVIKEAMAANCPIVTTDVGDVECIIGNTRGCFIIRSFETGEAAEKLRASLMFGNRTTGRKRIVELGLDDVSIAREIIGIYSI